MALSTWRELIRNTFHDAKFYIAASVKEIAHAERELGVDFPVELRQLLGETNGVAASHSAPLIWPLEEIIAQNRHFRSSKAFARLYAPFTDLLFFGADGGGDQFAYRLLQGEVVDTSIYRWDHETDARVRIASDLKDFFARLAASIEPRPHPRRSFLDVILSRFRGVFRR